MKPRIPEIINLLKRLENDPHWKDFRLVYNYFNKKTVRFINEILDDIPEKEEQFRLYLYDFLFRTRRIFSSIVLLAIYGKLADMDILYRPLLENIIQTKILLKGRRTKSVRAINLYRLIIKLNEQKMLMDEPLEDKNDIDILFGDQESNNSDDVEKLEKELADYYEEEIYKMEKAVRKGSSWHGRSIKAALKECNLIDGYQDYVDSCKFIHVRDYGLTQIDHYGKDNYTKMKLFSVGLSCILHLEDFKKTCPNSFPKKKKSNEIDYVEILAKMVGQILIVVSPRFRNSIEKLHSKSID